MGILTRYLIREFFRVLFPVWFGMGFLLFVLEYLSQVFSVKGDASLVLLIYLYKVPAHLALIFPLAVLVCVLVVLGAANRSGEITAAQAMGYGRRALLGPCLLAVVFSGAVQLYLVNSIAPMGMRAHYEVYDTKIKNRPSRFGQFRQERIWYRNQDVLYNVRYFDAEKAELYDVTIYTFDEQFKVAQQIYAKRARWTGVNWILSDGTVSVTDSRLPHPVVEEFGTRSTSLLEPPKALQQIELSAETMSQSELVAAIRRHKALGINTARWETSLHSRWSFLAVAVVFLLLAFPLALRFSRNAGVGRDAALSLAISLGYWVVFNYMVNLGGAGRLSPAVAAWSPVVLAGVVVAIYWKRSSFKRLSD